ncbi:uncharacterized protein BJ212DRAFT_1368916 [Suillus subaureus]|uniref:NAD(P)-binding domain-containing protein n=1 Tax=Suillus subaureus TaxID=48587 RepID=A0A9P7E6V6_9AGAM|nr:uncharacterized protein BJ212DRAFT_1368916 [Suillus subaureus]KAG1812909.1 hypothetical protein BJ212DRAFT_1368916 [Suillus subaureus]
MENFKVLVIGGSRNIGYYSAVRLLALGATVTFLLRSPQVFDQDDTIQNYIKEGKARLIQGDALVKNDVRRAWPEARVDDTRPVDFLIFTVGGPPHFSLTKGVTLTPPNLVTQSLINVLETLPSPRPKIIAVSSIGIMQASHKSLPIPLKPFYRYILPALHKDKRGAEEAIAHSAGWEWDARDSAGDEILGVDWTSRIPNPGEFKSVVVIRPALLTDGECRADVKGKGSEAYRVKEGDLESTWTISRKDVAHFLVEGVVRHWQEWEGKCASIAY